VPGAFPSLEGSKVVLGRQEDQIALLLTGKQGTAMASFKQLSDVELAAVSTYLRNTWGNKAEDNIVQPVDFKSARK
jgi:cytochrome c oxidase subunit 2